MKKPTFWLGAQADEAWAEHLLAVEADATEMRSLRDEPDE